MSNLKDHIQQMELLLGIMTKEGHYKECAELRQLMERFDELIEAFHSYQRNKL